MDEGYVGMYRALVVDNKDPGKFGKVKVWCADLMDPDQIQPESGEGLWARSANNPIGGRNNEYYGTNSAGTSFVPEVGSYVWIFFEKNNPNNPYYFGACDLENVKTLPENRTGEYQKKWTMFKSAEGRAIVISDDKDDARVEITGKKRKMKTTEPGGDEESVYKIDGNQTTILFDERKDQEKILIKTHEGDFLKIDVTNRQLQISFKSGITIVSEDDITISSKKSISLMADEDINLLAKNNIIMEAIGIGIIGQGTNLDMKISGNVNMLASGDVNIDGASTYIQSGKASPNISKPTIDDSVNGSRNI
jgi:hypothetical protein